jgi:hypothetical protein
MQKKKLIGMDQLAQDAPIQSLVHRLIISPVHFD